MDNVRAGDGAAGGRKFGGRLCEMFMCGSLTKGRSCPEGHIRGAHNQNPHTVETL